jgi:hypothetical protein
MRGVSVLAVATVLGACATVVPPKSVAIKRPVAQHAATTIVDVRPPEAKSYREEESPTTISKYFADETLQPQFGELLSYKLADAIPPHLQGSRIELRQADIGFRIIRKPPYSGGQTYAPAGVPAGAVILGNLLGFALIEGLRRATASEYGVSYIVIAIDDQPLNANESIAIKEGKTADEAVREAVSRTLDLLAEGLAAIKPPEESAKSGGTEEAAVPAPAR